MSLKKMGLLQEDSCEHFCQNLCKGTYNTFISSYKYLGKIAESYGRCTFNFLRNFQMIFEVAVPFKILLAGYDNSDCFPSWINNYMVISFNLRNSYKYVMISHCDLCLHSSNK